MPASIFESDYVVKQRRWFENGGADWKDAIQASFSFDIEKLPLVERTANSRALNVEGIATSFELKCGLSIFMTEFYQCSSQEGVLAGVVHPLSSFEDALKKARQKFPNFSGVPVGLAPVLHCKPLADCFGRDDRWIAVPPVCTIAMFESLSPAKDTEADFSEALVIWFQDAFGTEINERTKGQLLDMSWGSIAVDGFV